MFCGARRAVDRSETIRNPKSEVTTEQTLPIVGDYITLVQFLKAANVVSTGGEAKFYLAENIVAVNGEPEQRRGRKLRPGDLVIAPGAEPTRLVVGDGTENSGNTSGEEDDDL